MIAEPSVKRCASSLRDAGHKKVRNASGGVFVHCDLASHTKGFHGRFGRLCWSCLGADGTSRAAISVHRNLGPIRPPRQAGRYDSGRIPGCHMGPRRPDLVTAQPSVSQGAAPRTKKPARAVRTGRFGWYAGPRPRVRPDPSGEEVEILRGQGFVEEHDIRDRAIERV